MTPQTYVRAHLALLLTQYGERAVIEALAPLLGKPLPELEALLTEVHKVGHARQKKPAKPAKTGQSFEALLADYPDKADVLRQIHARFSNRTFLPELKDVRRFLDRHGQPSFSVKKRDDAFTKIARQLAQLPLTELEATLVAPSDSSFSSLGVISDQILGRK